MTPEQRLDRLERVAKLFVRAGLRTRRELRDHDKISYLIDLQMHNEELQKQNEVRFGRLAESQATLAESQTNTERRLGALIEIVSKVARENSDRRADDTGTAI